VKCQACRIRPATIHKPVAAGEPRWLCERCAAAEARREAENATDPTAMEAFLVDDLVIGADAACPGCGWTAARFRDTQRLGCPACYGAFRSLLMPLLGRLHRHVSHLGRAPRLAGSEPGRLASITRNRAALEKAIAAEDFEAAAALRDRIRNLEDPPPAGPDAP